MNKAINSIAIKYKYMKDILQERFFQLLLECSQRKVSVTEFTEAIEELATHLADFSCNEQDYSVLLRYFSFGLHRLKSGKSSVSCPLKPSDSAPLKHSTMPP